MRIIIEATVDADVARRICERTAGTKVMLDEVRIIVSAIPTGWPSSIAPDCEIDIVQLVANTQHEKMMFGGGYACNRTVDDLTLRALTPCHFVLPNAIVTGAEPQA